MNVTQAIEQKLAVLQPSRVELVDDSFKHVGHEGAKDGGGHYSLTIVSRQFAGKNTLARHRMIYAALESLMHREIHALAIRARTPEETQTYPQP